jgi:hypothetical protein
MVGGAGTSFFAGYLPAASFSPQRPRYRGTFRAHPRLLVASQQKGNEMTTANEPLKSTVNSDAARPAADAADKVSEFAIDVSRKAGKQFARARDMASDTYEEVHEASKDYPHVTLALAAALGFLPTRACPYSRPSSPATDAN